MKEIQVFSCGVKPIKSRMKVKEILTSILQTIQRPSIKGKIK